MLEKLEKVRKAAHDSMWYSHPERKDAYADLVAIINELKSSCEAETEEKEVKKRKARKDV